MNLKCIFFISIICTCCVFSTSAQIQIGDSLPGLSSIISGDGNTIAISFGDQQWSKGKVSVYKNVDDNWLKIGADIPRLKSQERESRTTALNDDGNILAIASDYETVNGINESGLVRVYQNNKGTWNQLGSDIVGDSLYARFGCSISLSKDGETIAIGAMAYKRFTGFVKVFKLVNNNWKLLGSPILGPAEMSFWGSSVSLSGDGNFLAVSTNYTGNGAELRTYRLINNDWTQIGSKFTAPAKDDLGYINKLSHDGKTIAISYYNFRDTTANYFRVFEINNGNWSKTFESKTGRDLTSADISRDGKTITLDKITFVGKKANGQDSFSSNLRVYKKDQNNWKLLRQNFNNISWATSLSLSDDGSILSISGGYHFTNGRLTWSNGSRAYKVCPSEHYVSRTICDFFTNSKGEKWNYNGQYKDTLVNFLGCDSVVNYDLTVIETDKLISTHPQDQSVDLNRSTNFIVSSSYDSEATYQWQLDDGAGFKDLSNAGQYSGVLTDTLLISNVTSINNGEIFRCIVTVKDCSDTTSNAKLTVGVSNVNTLNTNPHFLIYPNPARETLNIESDLSSIGKAYTIYSITGKEISTGNLTSQNTINIEHFSDGVYFISLGEEAKQTYRFIKSPR